jgi:hypothetical protein
MHLDHPHAALKAKRAGNNLALSMTAIQFAIAGVEIPCHGMDCL